MTESLSRLILAVEHSNSRESSFWLALAGWIWFICFLWPGNILNTEGFLWLGAVANEETWTVAWFIYASFKTWRLVFRSARPIVTIGVNFFGCLLFLSTAIATSIAAFPVPPVWPANTILAIMSCWVLFKAAFPDDV